MKGNPPVAEGAFDMMMCSEVVEHLYVNLSTVLAANGVEKCLPSQN